MTLQRRKELKKLVEHHGKVHVHAVAQRQLDDSLRLRDAAITMDVDDPLRDTAKDRAAELAHEGAEMLLYVYSLKRAKP